DAEIGQLNIAIERNHDVLKAHVTMNDTERLASRVRVGVRVGQASRYAAGDKYRDLHGKRVFLLHELGIELLQVHPPNQLHRDEVNAARFAELIGLDDVGVN